MAWRYSSEQVPDLAEPLLIWRDIGEKTTLSQVVGQSHRVLEISLPETLLSLDHSSFPSHSRMDPRREEISTSARTPPGSIGLQPRVAYIELLLRGLLTIAFGR